jgi:hypothetical protein
MRNSLLAIAVTLMLAAPCTALAGDKGKQRNIEVNDYGFGVSNPVTTSRSDGGGATKRVGSPTTKGTTTTPTTTGIMPGWNTCTSDACPSPLTNSKLLGSGGASGAVAGSKAKLAK